MTIVISIHGIYGTKYTHYPLISQLNKLKYTAMTFDYSSLETLAVIADQLSAFITENNPHNENVVLVGHSAGGRIALKAKHPCIKGLLQSHAQLMVVTLLHGYAGFPLVQ